MEGKGCAFCFVLLRFGPEKSFETGFSSLFFWGGGGFRLHLLGEFASFSFSGCSLVFHAGLTMFVYVHTFLWFYYCEWYIWFQLVTVGSVLHIRS